MQACLVSSSLDFIDLKVPNLSSRLIHFAPGASRNSGNAPRGPRVWGVEEAESLILICLENSRKPLGISLAPLGTEPISAPLISASLGGQALSLQNPLEMHLPQGWKCRIRLREGLQKKGC